MILAERNGVTVAVIVGVKEGVSLTVIDIEGVKLTVGVKVTVGVFELVGVVVGVKLGVAVKDIEGVTLGVGDVEGVISSTSINSLQSQQLVLILTKFVPSGTL